MTHYREETDVTPDVRWNDRITYDGTWENNLFNFFQKVAPKLTADLKKPFRLEGMQRIDDTPQHKAVREALVNMIIHSDYQADGGTLKVIKTSSGFSFTNPGILKLPKEEIYKGGTSKPRNPKMQTMLRFVGFGDNAGSGFPAILAAWADAGWPLPELIEDTILDQVTLKLNIISGDAVNVDGTHQEADTTKETTNKTTNKSKILAILETHPDYTAVDIAREIGLTDNGVRYHLDRLKKEGIIRRQGSKKVGHWEIIKPMD